MRGFRNPGLGANAIAAAVPPPPPGSVESSGALDKAELAVDSLDLIDLGVDIVSSGLDALGDLF